ncbi:MAG TPA: nucleotide sugar dehydrogenase [bacterium]|nr:nucleotide sugar dehydrogenase [bacterium]
MTLEHLAKAGAALSASITSKTATVGIIGLGYVGLPLAVEFARAGFPVVGIDVDRTRVHDLNAGRSYIPDVPTETVADLVARGRLRAAFDFDILREIDAVIICVQTPLTSTKEPDLTYVTASLQEVRRYLHPGQLVVLQSTTYPGTTEEVALPLLAGSGLTVGRDFFLAFSPERVDPGNTRYATRDIPKVVGGITPVCGLLGQALLEHVVPNVHRVSSARAAETTKLLENVYRSVNIALANELAILCRRMDVNIWEVIDAAATKPFGFAAFYPGPGVGGHCIPVDPHYLTWKARAYEFNTRLTAAATEVNEEMPRHVAEMVRDTVNMRLRKSIAGARILALGVAYKTGVPDPRESPAVKVLALLANWGASVAYHDAMVPRVLVDGREYESVPLSADALKGADCVVILTEHRGIDYGWVVEHAKCIFDTRNATRSVPDPDRKVARL